MDGIIYIIIKILHVTVSFTITIADARWKACM